MESTPIKEGVLVKKGDSKKIFKSAHRRHITLYPKELQIHELESGGAVKHRINILNASIIQPAQMPSKKRTNVKERTSGGNNDVSTFAVVTMGRAYEFEAASTEEAAEWTKALEIAILKAQAVELEVTLTFHLHPHHFHSMDSVVRSLPPSLLTGFTTMENDGRYEASFAHAYLRQHRVNLGTLHAFALGGNTDALKSAIESGPWNRPAAIAPFRWAVSPYDEEGASPLHCAAYSGEIECMLLLLDADSSLCSLADKAYGNTPLHAAAIGARTEAAKLLLTRHKNSVDVNAVNKRGQTALDIVILRARDRALLLECEDNENSSSKETHMMPRSIIKHSRSKVHGTYVRLAGTLGECGHVGCSVQELLLHGSPEHETQSNTRCLDEEDEEVNDDEDGGGDGSGMHHHAIGKDNDTEQHYWDYAASHGRERQRSSAANWRIQEELSSARLEDLANLVNILCDAGANASDALAENLVDDDDDDDDDREWHQGRTNKVLPVAIVKALLHQGAKPNLRKRAQKLSASGKGETKEQVGLTPVQRILKRGIPRSWMDNESITTVLSAKNYSTKSKGSAGYRDSGIVKHSNKAAPIWQSNSLLLQEFQEEGDIHEEREIFEVLLELLRNGARLPPTITATAETCDNNDGNGGRTKMNGSTLSVGTSNAKMTILSSARKHLPGVAKYLIEEVAGAIALWRALKPPSVKGFHESSSIGSASGSARQIGMGSSVARISGLISSTALSTKPKANKKDWTPDKASRACLLCCVPFTTTNRRHHCRKCGDLVCGACSTKKVYHKNTVRSSKVALDRACDRCFNEARWQVRRDEKNTEYIKNIAQRLQHEFIADYDAFSDEESSNGESRSDEDIIEEGDNGEVKEDEESTTKQQLQENTKSLESVHEKYTNLAEAAMNYSQLAMKAKSKK